MKRMFDKEEIVEIAKEGSVTVDSELSSTSENPVQNKVITEALGKVLPDTTGQEGNFLKVGSEGLEWSPAGSGGKYRHTILMSKNNQSSTNGSVCFSFIDENSNAYTNVNNLLSALTALLPSVNFNCICQIMASGSEIENDGQSPANITKVIIINGVFNKSGAISFAGSRIFPALSQYAITISGYYIINYDHVEAL